MFLLFVWCKECSATLHSFKARLAEIVDCERVSGYIYWAIYRLRKTVPRILGRVKQNRPIEEGRDANNKIFRPILGGVVAPKTKVTTPLFSPVGC
jgi:hypothetical protein